MDSHNQRDSLASRLRAHDMKIRVGMASDPGQKRSGQNQDRIGRFAPGWLNRKPLLLLVADGMGGYKGGEIASSLVVQTMLDCYRSQIIKGSYLSVLEEAVVQAHTHLKQKGSQEPQLATMGSTVVAAVVNWPVLHLLNVGDSRAYVVRGQSLEQVSTDQSLVAEMVRKGEIKPEEALAHPKRNVLTMSISAARNQVTCMKAEIDLQPGDSVLLCSDGLWAVVPEKEIIYYIENFAPQEAADDLVKLANAYGGPDNISVIIAKCI